MSVRKRPHVMMLWCYGVSLCDDVSPCYGVSQVMVLAYVIVLANVMALARVMSPLGHTASAPEGQEGRTQVLSQEGQRVSIYFPLNLYFFFSWLLRISFCCQYIVIFLSFIPGSERMAIYIAPLYCHGECVSSSRKHKNTTKQKH